MIKCSTVHLGTAELEAVQRVFESGNLAQGQEVAAFERAWAEYVGCRYAIAVSSGTAALMAALDAAGVDQGDKVVVSPLGFFATVEAVLAMGATPIFAPVAADGGIDVGPLDEIMPERIAAIVPVHLFGWPSPMPAIWEWAQTRKAVIIEDCAQAHGATLGGKHVGAFGAMGCFSFYATKHVTTGGEGGIVVTDNWEYADRVRRYRSHGMSSANIHSSFGLNLRMTEIQAAIGLAHLETFSDRLTRRRAACRALWRGLDHPDITPFQNIKMDSLCRTHSFFWCPVKVSGPWSAQRFKQAMADEGVEVRHRYDRPFSNQPVLSRCDWGGAAYGLSHEIASHVVGLPARDDLTEDEIALILDAVHTVLNR